MGKSIYLIAFISLFAIFLVTMFFVNAYETQVFSSIDSELRQIQLENQFESLFYDLVDDPNAYCEGRSVQVALTTKRLELLDRELRAQKESFLGDYVPTKKSFLMTNLLLYYNVVKLNNECQSSIKPIIYFYAEDKSCEIECTTIESQLERLKEKCPDVRVFAFPFNWDEFVFSKIIENEFNVKKAGTIIVDGRKFDSIQKQNVLEEALGCI